MFARRSVLALLTVVAAITAGVPTIASASVAPASVASASVASASAASGSRGSASAVPDTIPFRVENRSGHDGPIHLYVNGTNLTTGQQGWADANGVFHAWPPGGEPPIPAPDTSIPGPANGQSVTIQIPKLSGRVYLSYGQKIAFRLATGGLVQPAVQNPSDPNRNVLFNFSEYTLNDAGIWINSTQVDMFTAPYSVGVRRGDGNVATTGHLKPGGFQAVLDGLRAQEGGWGGLIQTGTNGQVLRALSPNFGIETGALQPDVLNDYIDRVWAKYSSETMTVTPFEDRPEVKFFGKVSGDVLNFTDGSGATVTSYQKPDAESIFGCHKRLDAPNDQVRGPISRTLCAGFNRSNLLVTTEHPDKNAANFYQDRVTNHYSRLVHAQMEDGKAYGFPFDDVGHFESLLHDPGPQEALMTLEPMS